MKYPVKFAIGNLKRSSFTTMLNLVGLTSAFIAFILIMLYVWNEYHFDGYNEYANDIYRLEVKSPDNQKTSLFLMGPTGKTLVDEFPEIELSTTYMPWGKWAEESFTWEREGNEIKSFEDYAYSDEYLTDIFTFHILRGKQIQPLLEPQSVMVTESFARKAWGKADPIGKHLKIGKSVYTVSAVFADLPENSVIRCPVILKIPTTGRLAEDAKGWNIVNYPQFIKVKQGTSPDQLNERINKQSTVRSKYNFYHNGTVTAELVARPLRDLHFAGEVAESPIFTPNNRLFVNSLFLVGILILVVALINYVNFATANVPRRIKSISITRIIGGSRLNSVFVFISETVLLFFLSFLVAIEIAYLVNQYFTSQVLGYTLPFLENYGLLLAFGTGCLVLGVLTGLFPALYSTTGKPVETLKRFQVNSGINFRGVLTVSQFVATIALIAVSLLVVKQVRFMEEINLGFNKNNTLVIRINEELRKNYTTFENKLRLNPIVREMACSRAIPGQAQEINTFNVNGQSCPIWYWAVDDKYISMMGFELVKGRNFLKSSEAEVRNMICNEAAIRKFGWTLGTKIGDGVLVGIMKDFNFVSLREEVEPFAFWYANTNSSFGYVSIKLSGENVREALSFVSKVYDECSPEIPFRCFFLDEHLNLLYSGENQQARLIITFSLLSVIVSILGILGLSTFMSQYRIKEIGIRKVNGARVTEILAMLNKSFIKWVAIAFVIACPIAWYAMNKWLENFAYKTSLSWWIFVLAGVLALGIALLTVSWQSWRTATKNPVKALRYE